MSKIMPTIQHDRELKGEAAKALRRLNLASLFATASNCLSLARIF